MKLNSYALCNPVNQLPPVLKASDSWCKSHAPKKNALENALKNALKNAVRC